MLGAGTQGEAALAEGAVAIVLLARILHGVKDQHLVVAEVPGAEQAPPNVKPLCLQLVEVHGVDAQGLPVPEVHGAHAKHHPVVEVVGANANHRPGVAMP